MSRDRKAAAVAMNATFRIPRKQARDTAFAALFFAAIGIATSLVFFFAAPPERRLAAAVTAIALAGVFFAFAAWGAWESLACLRHRLVVSDERIENVGVMRRKTFSLSEIASAKWRCWPVGGSLVLRTTGARLAIDFGNYEREDRRQIIRYFRESVPLSLQVGWDLFYVRIVKRASACARQLAKIQPGEGEVLITRRRFDWYFFAGLLGIIALTSYVYASDLDVEMSPPWVAVPAWLVFWVILRSLFPRKGSVSTRLSATPGGRSMAWLFLSLFAAMVCGIVLKLTLPELETPFTIGFFALWSLWAIATLRHVVRGQSRRERQATDAEGASGQLVPDELMSPWTQS